jgi:hypothetical protein
MPESTDATAGPRPSPIGSVDTVDAPTCSDRSTPIRRRETSPDPPARSLLASLAGPALVGVGLVGGMCVGRIESPPGSVDTRSPSLTPIPDITPVQSRQPMARPSPISMTVSTPSQQPLNFPATAADD